MTPSIAQLFNLPVKHGAARRARSSRAAAAAKAGLKGATTQDVVAGETWALGGDIIVQADGVATPTVNKLSDVIANHKPGDTIELVVLPREYEAND